MQFDFHRLFVVILASAAAAFCLVSISADEQSPKPSDKPPEVQRADHDDLSSKILATNVPLDLSELLESLGEIPALEDAPPVTRSSTIEPHEGVQLVGTDEPIIIGSGEESQAKDPLKSGPAARPSNPLRNRTEESRNRTEEDKTGKTIEGTAKVPSPDPKADQEALLLLELPTGDDKNIPKLSDASASIPVVRPKPKMVEVKPITQDEQESPQLSELPHAADAKQAREEDEKAVVAKRPEAATKTFIGKSSTQRRSSPGVPGVRPSDPATFGRAHRVEQCLSYYMANPELVVERSPWAVMHAMLPFGVEGEIIVGNRRVNSIQWMCYNGTCRTQKLFTPAGRYFRPNIGGGVQGHEGQFLAMLAQSQVSADYPIVVGQNKYTVTDLIRYEMATCKEKAELTFKLIGLSYYIDTDQIWLTDKRSRWNIEKLVQEELAQPINGAACGGTHRLMGLTFAVRQRKAEGRPIDGQFSRADRYVKEFVDYAWKLQNPDGSFSTNWFESRGNEPNAERKVQTTGHILEWLAFTVPDEELTSPRFSKGIDFLLSQIWDQRRNKWPIGPRGHATRAIALYHQRTTGIVPGQRQSQMAEQIQSQRIVR